MRSTFSAVRLVAVGLTIALFAVKCVSTIAAEAQSDAGGNAAMKYWQAFALLPALDTDQEKLLDQWNKIPLDAVAMKLIDGSQASREYLLRGAKLAHCDWSLDLDDGIFLRLPFLAKAKMLARLTALHARHEFSQKHWESGWNDVFALFKLARDVETAPMMIAQLVGYSIEAVAIDTTAPYLPELKSALPPHASALLDKLPKELTAGQLLTIEKQVGPIWLRGRLRDAERKQPGSWQAVWKETFDAVFSGSEGAANANRDTILAVKSYEQATKWLDELLPLYDEGVKIAELRWDEFDAAYANFVKKAKAVNSLTETFYPNLDKFAAMQRRHQAQAALFRAAVLVVQEGPEKINDVQDPFGAGPFEYRALDNGFELMSKLRFNNKPVTLTIGGAK
jgi:hypothetical protein